MNAKPDEYPDHHIRQLLDQLPDTPPPGSAFDAERLWGQLQPRLPKTAVRRRPRIVWWAAAACLTGVLLSRVWLMPRNDGSHVNIVRSAAYKASEPKPTGNLSKIADKPVLANATPVVRNQPELRKKPSLPKLVTVHANPDDPEKAVVQTLELPVVADSATAVAEPIEPARTTLVAAAPKRRFRVMHVNELTAEEEARPKLYRTEHFVRLGTGASQPQASTESVPALVIPFASKPNH